MMQQGLRCREKRLSSLFLALYFPAVLAGVFFVTGFLYTADSHAAEVTLAWDPSPEPVSSYTVFYGEESVLTNPSTPLPVGNTVTCTIGDLVPGHTYYFAVKAYDDINESGFSNEASYTVPAAGATNCPVENLLGENNPDLANFRSFRDKIRARNAMGRKIILIYYNNADSINAALESRPQLQEAAKRVLEALAPMVGG